MLEIIENLLIWLRNISAFQIPCIREDEREVPGRFFSFSLCSQVAYLLLVQHLVDKTIYK